jgi:hypothetical protein
MNIPMYGLTYGMLAPVGVEFETTFLLLQTFIGERTVRCVTLIGSDRAF